MEYRKRPWKGSYPSWLLACDAFLLSLLSESLDPKSEEIFAIRLRPKFLSEKMHSCESSNLYDSSLKIGHVLTFH